MEFPILRAIGLTENEIKIYLTLLRSGSLSAYEISQKTGIYRVHVYDKLEQLMEKGLVTHVFEGSTKQFQATNPEKIVHYLDEKKQTLASQEKEVKDIIPQLQLFASKTPAETRVEVYKGKEGLKYFLKDIVKTKDDVIISGVDDQKYMEHLPVFMELHFRDLKRFGIRERIITTNNPHVFTFSKKIAATTEYRFLDQKQFNPANTVVYGNKVAIVSWGDPITTILIQNRDIAETYRGHFEYLWSISKKKKA